MFAEGSVLLAKYEANEEKLLLKSLNAFVCASFILWMNSNWGKVEKLYSEEKTIVEKGGGDCCKQEKFYKMSWLEDLFVNCTADILDPESVSFFVKKAQKQQLESLIVKENIEQKSLVNQDKKQKTRKGKNGTLTNSKCCNISNNNTKQTKGQEVDEDLNVTSKNVEAIVNTGEKCTTDETDAQNKTDRNSAVVACVSEIAQKVDKATYEVEPLIPPADLSIVKSVESDTQEKIDENMAVNFDVSEAAAKVKEATYEIESTISATKNDLSKYYADDTNFDEKESDSIVMKANTNGDVPKKNVTENNKIASLITKAEEIKALDKVLNMFESERVSAPSPFTAYMNIKYLIDNIVYKQDAKLAQRLQESCDCQWNKSHQ